MHSEEQINHLLNVRSIFLCTILNVTRINVIVLPVWADIVRIHFKVKLKVSTVYLGK